MDLEIIILSEVGQVKTNVTHYRLYVEPKKRHKWTYEQNRNRFTEKKKKKKKQLKATKGERGTGIN